VNESISSRERVLLALSHMETDRAPFSMGLGINRPAVRKLQEYLGHATEAETHDYIENFCDLKWTWAGYKGPKNRNTSLPDGIIVDIWGVGRKAVSYGEGEYHEICHYPLGGIKDISELDAFEWPDPEWNDVSNVKENIAKINEKKQYAIVLGNGNIFESSWYMRGFEQMFIDLIEEPELAWEIMTRVTDYFIAYFKRVLEAAPGMIDIVFTADDLGGQEGLLMSLDLWERMIKPHHVRMNKVLHEYGVKILYHSDGSIMKVVPGLMDMGIDILEALQFSAKGMDPVALKENYGDKLCFHGGISVQSTLPFGSVDEVKNEVRERIDVLGKNGGYIVAPSHSIQAGTPPENIVAFFETARDY
jgi:uroporphyrinogen decarboxylase